MKKNIQVIAHRGFSGLYPENTLIAFEKAIEIGVDTIELDIQLSNDNQLIVFHDKTLNRITGETGNISELSAKHITSLDAGSWYDAKYSGQKIPLLKDVLILCKKQVNLNIELKPTTAKKQLFLTLLLQTIQDLKIEDQIFVSSFDIKLLEEFKQVAPLIPSGLLFNNKEPKSQLQLALTSGLKAINPIWALVDQEIITQTKKHNMWIYPWTVDDINTMIELADMNVTGIITNYPDKLINILNN